MSVWRFASAESGEGRIRVIEEKSPGLLLAVVVDRGAFETRECVVVRPDHEPAPAVDAPPVLERPIRQRDAVSGAAASENVPNHKAALRRIPALGAQRIEGSIRHADAGPRRYQLQRFFRFPDFFAGLRAFFVAFFFAAFFFGEDFLTAFFAVFFTAFFFGDDFFEAFFRGAAFFFDAFFFGADFFFFAAAFFFGAAGFGAAGAAGFGAAGAAGFGAAGATAAGAGAGAGGFGAGGATGFGATGAAMGFGAGGADGATVTPAARRTCSA